MGDTTSANKFIEEYQKNKDQMKQTIGALDMMEEQKSMLENASNSDAIKMNNLLINKMTLVHMTPEEREELKAEQEKELKEAEEELKEFFKDYQKDYLDDYIDELKEEINKEIEVMNIVKTQNFIEGFWNINDRTKIIKSNYENIYKCLKDLKDYKIDDISAMTIIIIYYIYRNCNDDFLEKLVLIIKKSKLFIHKKIGESYENIIKKVPNIEEFDLNEFLAV